MVRAGDTHDAIFILTPRMLLKYNNNAFMCQLFC